MISAGCGAADTVSCSRRVGQQRLAESGEGALELTRQRRQVVNHQRQLWAAAAGQGMATT